MVNRKWLEFYVEIWGLYKNYWGKCVVIPRCVRQLKTIHFPDLGTDTCLLLLSVSC